MTCKSGNASTSLILKCIAGGFGEKENKKIGNLHSNRNFGCIGEYNELSDDMKNQAVYDQADERYYFRVTEKQYKELTEKYDEAVKNAREKLKHVTYTYEELFG